MKRVAKIRIGTYLKIFDFSASFTVKIKILCWYPENYKICIHPNFRHSFLFWSQNLEFRRLRNRPNVFVTLTCPLFEPIFRPNPNSAGPARNLTWAKNDICQSIQLTLKVSNPTALIKISNLPPPTHIFRKNWISAYDVIKKFLNFFSLKYICGGLRGIR